MFYSNFPVSTEEKRQDTDTGNQKRADGHGGKRLESVENGDKESESGPHGGSQGIHAKQLQSAHRNLFENQGKESTCDQDNRNQNRDDRSDVPRGGPQPQDNRDDQRPKDDPGKV